MSTGPRFEDMPPDPDLDDVPPSLLANEGQMVTIVNSDGTTETAVLVIAPGLFGHARRLREGFHDGPNNRRNQ